MAFFTLGAGLMPNLPSPPDVSEVEGVVTEEASVQGPAGRAPHVTPLVNEGDVVARGAPVACLRHAPDIRFAAPIAGRVAQISLLPGRRLSEVILFREDDGGAKRHVTGMADSVTGLRKLMQAAGFWPLIGRRPFGGMPAHGEQPAAIVVMAADTRPHAPDPLVALVGKEEDFDRGLDALTRLTEGPVFVCHRPNADKSVLGSENARISHVECGVRHPQGAVGVQVHQLFPAGLEAPVWDMHAEDVAALGAMLATGELPMTRLVRIAGPALKEARTLRTHPGADIRQLTQRIVAPGPHSLMSGSHLDGHKAQWLAPRHRQITVVPRESGYAKQHWLFAALSQSAKPAPAIPTAALTQAFGGAVPALPFIRALSAGDDEGAMRLGILSLLEEDVALADYVLSEQGHLTAQLRAMLDRIQVEFAA